LGLLEQRKIGVCGGEPLGPIRLLLTAPAQKRARVHGRGAERKGKRNNLSQRYL